MKSGALIIVILIIALLGLSIYGSFKTRNSTSQTQDVFNGYITNMNLSPQVLDGTGIYDRSCLSIENGLSQCDAGIQTEVGLLNFNYKHNMQTQGCLDKGQNLKVEILANNQARVTRL